MPINMILAPAAVLVLWSLIILLWMAGTRFPAMARSGIDLSKAKPGGRGQDLEGVLPPNVSWKAHNYNHLMEQPTLFYAVVLILAALNGATPITVGLAWAYTGIRIIHSLWQVLVNRVAPRFALFALSSLCLIGLAIIAVARSLHLG
ncbi:MAG: MAPEG family protein [Sphingopyxis sp.]